MNSWHYHGKRLKICTFFQLHLNLWNRCIHPFDTKHCIKDRSIRLKSLKSFVPKEGLEKLYAEREAWNAWCRKRDLKSFMSKERLETLDAERGAWKSLRRKRGLKSFMPKERLETLDAERGTWKAWCRKRGLKILMPKQGLEKFYAEIKKKLKGGCSVFFKWQAKTTATGLF